MGEIDIRICGRAGRITLTRPQVLNALSHDMCLAIDAALRVWREDDAVDLVILDAEGDKAFCAGGDVARLYETGKAGDFDYGRRFWRDEYRLNAYLYEYPKPTVSFLQGFTMGGGVGIGCHCRHRVVCETSKIAMPECKIGLIPDVGGSLIFSKAPGQLGEYLGLTSERIAAEGAIIAGFADHYIPRDRWANLIERLESEGDAGLIATQAEPPPPSRLKEVMPAISRHFKAASLAEILSSLRSEDSDFARESLAAMRHNCPLSMACAVEIQQRLANQPLTIRSALEMEYRFIWRSMVQGDFLEGIRARIIDKDNRPQWQYADQNVPEAAVSEMLQPLGENTLSFEEE